MLYRQMNRAPVTGEAIPALSLLRRRARTAVSRSSASAAVRRPAGRRPVSGKAISDVAVILHQGDQRRPVGVHGGSHCGDGDVLNLQRAGRLEDTHVKAWQCLERAQNPERISLQLSPPLPQPSGGTAIDTVFSWRMYLTRSSRLAWMSSIRDLPFQWRLGGKLTMNFGLSSRLVGTTNIFPGTTSPRLQADR